MDEAKLKELCEAVARYVNEYHDAFVVEIRPFHCAVTFKEEIRKSDFSVKRFEKSLV